MVLSNNTTYYAKALKIYESMLIYQQKCVRSKAQHGCWMDSGVGLFSQKPVFYYYYYFF